LAEKPSGLQQYSPKSAFALGLGSLQFQPENFDMPVGLLQLLRQQDKAEG
jgi:hypothetical protein